MRMCNPSTLEAEAEGSLVRNVQKGGRGGEKRRKEEGKRKERGRRKPQYFTEYT